MLLVDYSRELTTIISEYSEAGLVIDSLIATDIRTEKVGLIKGNLTFVDGSKMRFTEYVDLRYRVDRLSYSFHYQDKEGQLIFRYDDAVHRPRLAFREHRHSKDAIGPATLPEFRSLLSEISEHVSPGGSLPET